MTWTEERVLATAREAYARGRADFPVEPGRCALLVIDMQPEFLAPGPLWVPAATRIGRRSGRRWRRAPARLRNLGRDTVVITGTLTNYCCGTTARQAYERGYQVVFAADLTATDDPDMQEPELAVLRKGFARVATGEEIVGLLSGHVR